MTPSRCNIVCPAAWPPSRTGSRGKNKGMHCLFWDARDYHHRRYPMIMISKSAAVTVTVAVAWSLGPRCHCAAQEAPVKYLLFRNEEKSLSAWRPQKSRRKRAVASPIQQPRPSQSFQSGPARGLEQGHLVDAGEIQNILGLWDSDGSHWAVCGKSVCLVNIFWAHISTF